MPRSTDAKRLLSIRIPPELDRQIAALAKGTERDKTSIAVELLQRGLETRDDAPIKSAKFVPREDFESLQTQVAALSQEFRQLRGEQEPAEKKPAAAAA